MGESRNRRLVGFANLFALLLLLSACTSGGDASTGRGAAGDPSSAAYAPIGGGGSEEPSWEAQGGTSRRTPRNQAARQQTPEPRQDTLRAAPTGAEIRVTWEALAVERDLFENPRFRRQGLQRGVLANSKIVIVSESHAAAKANRSGRAARGSDGVSVATLPDDEMELFVKGLERRGYFRMARPTSSLERVFQDQNARGRVTVERGAESVTLVSMRGQGSNPATKAIPALYSEVKRAIIVLRNQTPTMTVVGMGRDPLSR